MGFAVVFLQKRSEFLDLLSCVTDNHVFFGFTSNRKLTMPSNPSFHQVLDQLRQKDNHAASEVYRRFASRLVGLARAHLDKRLAKRLDAEEVVQSVFKSVFLRLGAGDFVLGDWDAMWALLTAVAVNKCRKWVDYYEADKRDIKREEDQPRSDGSWHVIDREPSPSEALALAETLDQILHGLEPSEQEIVSLSLQGYTVAEIKTKLGCTQAKAYRILRLVRDRLERLREENA